MSDSRNGWRARVFDDHRLLAYVADLEVEVDRLRRHNRHVHQEARAALDRIQRRPLGAPEGAEVAAAVAGLAAVLDDLREVPGYHPAHDQVVAIAVRPLAEQVFRWQRRLQGADGAELRLELEAEHIDWFPARLRHILDSLVSNALKYRDTAKTGAWVRVGLRASPEGYELRVSDNGVGLPDAERGRLFDLSRRAALARTGGVGVGLAVVKLLVEQSGGVLDVDSGDGQGTTFVALLPRFDVEDYLGAGRPVLRPGS
jgi:signal transduction histidine kinase